MEAQGQAGQAVDESTLRRAIAACAIGNATEWFDYATYGFLAATLGAVFFPSGNETAQLLSAFAVFALTFFVRPLGGVFFGPLGDRIGRQRVLATTILLMAGATFVIGLLPSYATIGILAPILLLLLRLVQGFSAGGEYGGASTFMVEYAPDERRGYYASWLEFGTLVGFSLGAGLVTFMTFVLSQDAMTSWGWRIPFLIALPLGIVGLYLRTRLEDTPGFRALENAGEVAEAPLRELFRSNWRDLLLCGGIVIIYNLANYTLLTYMPSYLSDSLGISDTAGLLLLFIAILVMLVVITFVGSFSDRVGRKPVLIGAMIGFVVLTYPAFLLISVGSGVSVMAGLLIFALLQVLLLGTLPATLPALFPTKERYSGFAISYNVSTAAFGGTAPFVATALVSATGNQFMPAFYVMAAALVSSIPIWLMAETAKRPLRGSVSLSTVPARAQR
jgi:MFS transporter, MHS family, proline/betaine transporter